jgi:hypothetical protein
MSRVTLFLVSFAFILSAVERIKVKIIDRHDSENAYSYNVPQQVQENSRTDVNCTAYPNSANCSANTNTTGTITPPRQISYSVHGATFTLLMADGKMVVVNCESKYKPRGDHINRRSCRTPLVDELDVEFNKDNAKLFWPVSVDGKKLESETYKIIGIINKSKGVDNSAPKP